jgi:hypothetical protein
MVCMYFCAQTQILANMRIAMYLDFFVNVRRGSEAAPMLYHLPGVAVPTDCRP